MTNIDVETIKTEQSYLKHKIKTLKIDVGILPLHLFPNGKYYYTHRNEIKPFVIHFNWVKSDLKVGKMKKYKKWYI